MRSQRRAPQTVRLVKVTTTTSPVGDSTETRVVVVITGAIFHPPQPIQERVGPDAVPVLQLAEFHLPGVHVIDADDLIEEPADPADLDSAARVTWQVVGGGTVWLDRTQTPVQQTKAV